MELELTLNVVPLPPAKMSRSALHQSRSVTLLDGKGPVEFRRYGDANYRPLVLLHSAEYGYIPSDAFVDEAKRRRVCLYFPLRAGFGTTPKALSLTEAARTVSGFLEAMNLQDVILVALSTAAPTVLSMADPGQRISRTVFVNCALNTPAKIDYIQPLWMQGLVATALETPVALKLTMQAARKILKHHGAENLYRGLYDGFFEDLEFLSENGKLFDLWADYFIGADTGGIMLDVVSSFTNLRNIDILVRSKKRLALINGDNKYLVPNDHVRADAMRLGVEFYTVEKGSRNWLFADPVKFFNFLERLDDRDAQNFDVA